jgi:hypothetical protein
MGHTQLKLWSLNFLCQVVKVGKGWVEQEFVLLIIAALTNGAVLPRKYPTGYLKNIKNIKTHQPFCGMGAAM